jgi:DNA polymerase elongation subunit (family B)
MYVFLYHWFAEDEPNQDGEKELAIRAYGLTDDGKTVLIHVRNFRPWMYFEITPSTWTASCSILLDRLKERCPSLRAVGRGDFRVQKKQRLYFSDGKEDFLHVPFTTIEARRKAYYALNNRSVRVLSSAYGIRCHENDASPLLQLLVSRGLPSCGWVSFQPGRVREKITSLEHEYSVDFNRLESADAERITRPVPTVLSFDIEVYSSNPQRMPRSDVDADCIFQIGCSVNGRKHLLTLYTATQPEVGRDVSVRCFDSEAALLLGFTALVREINPNVMIGYNIFGFDMPYMTARARRLGILHEFDVLGVPLYRHAPEREIKWSSKAYSCQEFHYLDTEGRILVDLLPVVQRDYKFSNYRLKTVSTFFLGETKDPLTPKDIFAAYEAGRAGRTRELSLCGKYCVQDAHLVMRLYDALQLWIGLGEMAKICCVPMMYLFTKGQQIKVYSQIFQKCYRENILVQAAPEHPVLTPAENGYSGAYVFPPRPGIYDWVIPFDFSSLYPTTIIAYNIDYSTLVLDESSVDLSACHVIEWDDHVNCEHDPDRAKSSAKQRVLCGHHRFVFRKEPMGVMPSLLQNLISQRNETKKTMKAWAARTDVSDAERKTALVVLDKRQLAYKLSANSGYGAMGVTKGYLPFMPGAMSTTAMGRMSIQKAAEHVRQRHSGRLIYGDSVTASTPLLLSAKDGKTTILGIEELFDSGVAVPYPEFVRGGDTDAKERIEVKDRWIMSSGGWAKIRRVIRHKTAKRVYRVCTGLGIIEATEDHSLLDDKKEMIVPKDAMGRRLLVADRAALLERLAEPPAHAFNRTTVRARTEDVLEIRGSSPAEMQAVFLRVWLRFPHAVLRWVSEDRCDVCLSAGDTADASKVVRVDDLGATERWVYDIETEDGSFHAGVGLLVVKNTDSIYCHFEGAEKASAAWEKAKSVEKELLRLFPSPMKLVFEEKIYQKFLILTKKRYMAYTCGEDGTVDDKLTIRGVLLARRDNCRWIRGVYEEVVRRIMDGVPISGLAAHVNETVLSFLRMENRSVRDLIVTKQYNAGYKIRALPEDEKKLRKRLADLGIVAPAVPPAAAEVRRVNDDLSRQKASTPWAREYLVRALPAHAQLALKMTERGSPVEAGSRIEYLILEHADDPKSRLYDKLEDPVYYSEHRDLLRIDRLYYLRSLVEPLDQLMNVVGGWGIVQRIHAIHARHHLVMREIRERSGPLILLDDEQPKKPPAKKTKRQKPILVRSFYDLL